MDNMVKQLSKEKLQNIRRELPKLNELLEHEIEYKKVFVSVFDHWLTMEEVGQIFTKDKDELKSRRTRLEKFIKELYSLTDTYIWRYKRHKRVFVCQTQSLGHLLQKCDIQNQCANRGLQYDIILPDLSAVYSEECDWTNIIWYRDEERIKPLIEIAKKAGLHILE
jgi:hypothetical protein